MSTPANDDIRLSRLTDWLAKLEAPKTLPATLRPASSDASFRRYFRVDVADGGAASAGAVGAGAASAGLDSAGLDWAGAAAVCAAALAVGDSGCTVGTAAGGSLGRHSA